MDTPLPGQIRPIQQEAGQATEAEVMELVEMILGALGRDALGLGSSIAHPRESDEWKSMTAHEKLEFFAPIWRIMRDENMTVEQVSLFWHKHVGHHMLAASFVWPPAHTVQLEAYHECHALWRRLGLCGCCLHVFLSTPPCPYQLPGMMCCVYNQGASDVT